MTNPAQDFIREMGKQTGIQGPQPVPWLLFLVHGCHIPFPTQQESWLDWGLQHWVGKKPMPERFLNTEPNKKQDKIFTMNPLSKNQSTFPLYTSWVILIGINWKSRVSWKERECEFSSWVEKSLHIFFGVPIPQNWRSSTKVETTIFQHWTLSGAGFLPLSISPMPWFVFASASHPSPQLQT